MQNKTRERKKNFTGISFRGINVFPEQENLF